MSDVTFGLIVGKRGFFPAHLCASGREEMLNVLNEEGFGSVSLTPGDTEGGAVQTAEDVKKCVQLFKEHSDEIDGIIVTLPNFGDEKAIANSIRGAGLDVPVLVHAFKDTPGRLDVANRRDAFCGKISVCNNLNQYGIPFTLTTLHCDDPGSETFRSDLRRFAGICRVVRSLKSVKIGAVGARPADFNTVRYSEKILEGYGISVETLDLSEVFGRARQMADDDQAAKDMLAALRSHTDVSFVPQEALIKMAKLAAVLDNWVKEKELAAMAVQCWTAMEEFYGVMPCAIMSLFGSRLIPSACEVDVTGVIAMYALQQASGEPSALVDWNNNYRDEVDKCVLFHCANYPASFFEQSQMGYGDIISTDVGKENAWGAMQGRIRQAPVTFARITTNDQLGRVQAYVGEGAMTDDELDTFGGRGVIHVPRLQELLKYVCRAGFEHHVAINLTSCADILHEAFENYLEWSTYHHS